MNGTLFECVEGRISPHIAIAHFLFAGVSVAEIEAEMMAAGPHPRLDEMRALMEVRRGQLDALSAHVKATVMDHHAHGATPAEGIANIAGFFDRAVAASPEASVALYSLGDPAILAATTVEIVDWLEGQGVLGVDRDVVDLGSGIGRVAAALSGRCRSVLGLDVSAGMVAEARRRHAGLENVRFERTAGQDLAMLEDESVDLILAIDSFPYVVQGGDTAIAQHLTDARRALRPGGALSILNVSYEVGDDDGALVTGWASRFGFTLVEAGALPFEIWDGTASLLRR